MLDDGLSRGNRVPFKGVVKVPVVDPGPRYRLPDMALTLVPSVTT